MAEDPEGTTLAFKKAARRSADYAQWQEYRKIVGDNVPKTFDDFQNFKYTDAEKWKYVKGLKKYLDKYPESSQPFYDIQQELKASGINRGVVLPPFPTAGVYFAEREKGRLPYHAPYDEKADHR